MAGSAYRLPAQEAVVLSAGAVQALVREGSGNAALLYIYILSRPAHFDTAEAAGALKLTVSEVSAAADTLVRLGLLSAEEAPQRPAPADELPEYTARDVTNALETKPDFHSLLDEVQQMLGKVLSQDDLLRLFGIYDALGFPAEVILQLVAYCLQESRRRYGPGRKPTMRQIEKTAYIWEREGLFSLELAERYIRTQSERHSKEAEFALALRISGRALTGTERAYVEQWMHMGFGPDAADIAFDRTVTGAGKLDWKYMNGIFKSWHLKGLHTASQIREGDAKPAQARQPRRSAPQQQSPAAGGPTQAELEQMKQLLDEINNG